MFLPRRRYRLAAVLLLPLLLATACSSSDKKEATSDNPGSSSVSEASKPSEDDSAGGYEPGDGTRPAQFPCDKVTAEEIGTLLGGTYTFKLGPQDQCDYDAEDAVTFPTAYISIDQFKKVFPTFKGANPGATDVDVLKGGFIADDPNAKTIKNGYGLVTDDGVTLNVSLVGGKQTDRDAKIEGLLKLAASKLKG